MLVYFIPILLCLLTTVCRNLSESKRWTIILAGFICLFFCFGYMTGSDWRAYELFYDELDFKYFYYRYNAEPGYYFLMMLMKAMHVPFWCFHIGTKVVLFILIFKTFFDYSPQTGWISLMYYMPWFGLYFFIDNPMRNCIAVGLFILTTKYILERNFRKFFWMSLLTAFFHLSALFVIPFYWVLTRDIKKWVLAGLYIVINLVFMNRDLLIGIITALFSNIPYFSDKVITYFLMDSVFIQGKLLSFGMLWQTALFVLLLCYKERVVEQIGGQRGMFAFNCSMVFLLLVRFAMSIQIFIRIQMYFSVYLCICIGLLILSFEWRSRLAYLCVLTMISMYTCYDKITGSARYVPYTNIIEYVAKGELPSFSKRYFYNIKKSPYTQEIDIPK